MWKCTYMYTMHQEDIPSDNSDKSGIICTNMTWQLGQAWSETGSYIIEELLGFGKYLFQLLLKFFVYNSWYVYADFDGCTCILIDNTTTCHDYPKKQNYCIQMFFLVNRGLSYLYKETSWYDDLEDLKTLKNTVGSATWHSDIPSCGSSLLITTHYNSTLISSQCWGYQHIH